MLARGLLLGVLRVLDHAHIDSLLQHIVDELEGDWLLIGGALVALWLDEARATEDVAIVGLTDPSEQRFTLLEVAEQFGLPAEALNSAADFFVRRIEGWQDELEVLRRGQRGTVFRASPTLFLLLKLSRLSARDLEDCQLLLARAASEGFSVDRARVRDALSALRKTDDEALPLRRRELLGLL